MAGLRIPVETKDGVRNLNKLDKGFKKVGASSVKSESMMKGFGGKLKGFAKGLAGVAAKAALAATALAGLATFAAAKVGKTFLQAATTTEGFQLRLQTLLGSAAAGNQMFKDMAEFAGKVPFEFEKIMESATNLAGILEPKEVKEWMPLVADLAAATGIAIEETTGQIQRMLSAGAASADLFREKGVLAMLGFTAGVSYSAEETREMLMKAWDDPASKFAGATDSMAASWDGMISMLSDAWFAFRNMVMDSGVFIWMKAGLKTVLDMVNRLRSEGDLATWAETLGASVVKAFKNIVVATGYVIDVFNTLRKVWIGLKQTWAAFMGGLAKGYTFLIEGNIMLAKSMAIFGGGDDLVTALEEHKATITDFADFQFELIDELQDEYQSIDPFGTYSDKFRKIEKEITATAEKIKKAQDDAVAAGIPILAGKPKAKEVSKEDLKVRGQFETAFDKATLTPYQLEMKQLDELVLKYEEVGIEKARIDEWYAVQREEILTNESERSIAEHKKMIEEMSEGYQTLQDDIVALGETIDNRFVDGLSDAITGFITGTKSAKQAFSEFATSFAIDVTRMIVKTMILNALQGAMGGSGMFGGMVNAGFGAFRANGGPVSAGRPYIVGERQAETFVSSQGRRSTVGANGPERFVPRQSGRIDPSAQAPAPQVNIANILDPSMLGEYMNSAEGSDAVMNVIANNRDEMGM